MLREAGGIRRVVLKTGRTDLRRGIDGPKAVISLNGMDPLEKGTLFLFCGRRNDRIRGPHLRGLIRRLLLSTQFPRMVIRTSKF